MLFDKNKKHILKQFLRHLSHIQDKEYQKRIWIRNEGPECQAFDDAVCDFFDIGDPILETYESFGITEIQHKLLINFRKKFKSFSDANDSPQEFIDSPEWNEIIESAKEVLKAFDYKKQDDPN